MGKPVFTASKTGSAAYFNALNEYMEANVLRPDKGFICRHEKACRESCRPENRDFYPGQLHHVGEYYALERNGKPFRIVISGAEYGHPSGNVSVAERTEGINNLIPDQRQHMMGTLFLLKLLFEQPIHEDGVDLSTQHSYAEINGGKLPFFQAFSLAHYLLCSARKGGKSEDAYTSDMQMNCQDHFKNALEILKPQIIVLQGIRSRDHGFWESNYKKSMTFNPPTIEEVQIKGCETKTLVLPLYHPTWRNKRWNSEGESCLAVVKEYVEPAVENLLKEYENIYG